MRSLIVRLPNHLGDACMALPALELLARNGFDLTLAARPWAKSLFGAHPWPVLPLGPGKLERVRALRAWRAAGHTEAQALLFTNSFSTALKFRAAGLRPIGYATDGRRWLLQRAMPVPARRANGMHMVEYYYALASQLVDHAPPVPDVLALRVAPAAAERARAMLAAAGISAPYVVLCPVAIGLHRGRVKAWNGFGRLGDELRARGEHVVACPGPGERDAVAQAVPAATLLPATDVGTFAALLAGSRLVVANDSGPGHLAAAVGARLVSIFGVTEPEQTRPWGNRVTLVGSARGWPDYAEVWAAVRRALSS